MKILRASRMEQCIGCYSCSLACARLVHGQLSWSNAGIAIRSSGGMTTGFEARVCVACDPAACARACPTGALAQRRGGGVKVRRELCIRCGQCAEACPVGAIHLGRDDGAPYVCIHCGRCVAFCPQNCLELVEAAAPTPRCELGAAGDGSDSPNSGRDEEAPDAAR
ncbi:MAG: 4Fe-4S binding protein [Desulfovibrionaceae bacterium]|jgi:Fe-S-cluster-containing dehydrogenase component|nr:4Fe-4S binding protein [Desulfovibrionaceae bacterium]